MKKTCVGSFAMLGIFLLFIAGPVFAFNTIATSREEGQECYMILVGKDATADGSILLAHDNDLAGHQASLIEKFPRMKHEAGEIITFPSGLEIPQVDETYEWMVLRIYSGFAEGDAIAINEYGVSIAGGVAQGSDRNKKAAEADPLINSTFSGP